MASWTVTKVTEYVVADRVTRVWDCTHPATEWGGPATGATGAVTPTLAQLGFANVTDSEMTARAYEIHHSATGTLGGRLATYDLYNQKLIVGATAAQDFSATTYRLEVTGKYSL